MKIKVGDIVAIRGDKRINNNGQCAYTSDQLIMGKYVKHTGHGGIWTGRVEEVRGNYVVVGGGLRPIDTVEIMYRSITNNN